MHLCSENIQTAGVCRGLTAEDSDEGSPDLRGARSDRSSCAGVDKCMTVGDVGYKYRIGRLEVTVRQYVKFLNTVNPDGKGL